MLICGPYSCELQFRASAHHYSQDKDYPLPTSIYLYHRTYITACPPVINVLPPIPVRKTLLTTSAQLRAPLSRRVLLQNDIIIQPRNNISASESIDTDGRMHNNRRRSAGRQGQTEPGSFGSSIRASKTRADNVLANIDC